MLPTMAEKESVNGRVLTVNREGWDNSNTIADSNLWPILFNFKTLYNAILHSADSIFHLLVKSYKGGGISF
ncbi:hypothetical protein XELAEV_18009782mg [Xenopus laevis]|uniref:Uncharacterized protein n=1 Tax=Xenopus laevis TaxID=8355 RepID=A0A974DSZ5_XENLA|nr:hypothetical protein XELAEV_18009782mg [Xenopus laevis]